MKGDEEQNKRSRGIVNLKINRIGLCYTYIVYILSQTSLMLNVLFQKNVPPKKFPKILSTRLKETNKKSVKINAVLVDH